MSEPWQKRLLIIAAAWNILGGAGAVLDPSQHFAQMYHGALNLDDPVQRQYFNTVWIAVIAWGFAYLGAALQASGRSAVLLAGAAGKLAYAGACVALFIEGAGTPALLAVGLADVVFAAFFILAARVRGETSPRLRPLPA